MSTEVATGPGAGEPTPARMGARQQFGISAYWFATNLLWMGFLIVILPAEVKRLAPANSAQSLGVVFGVCALPAFVVPLLVGPLSDRCRSRWGRRRPYMVVGVALNLLGMVVAYAGSLGLGLIVFALGYLVMNTGNNIATGAYSGIIPDVVPENQRGEASGWMGAMTQLGNLAGILAVGLLMNFGQMLASYLVMGGILLLFLGVTLVSARETPQTAPLESLRPLQFLKSLWIDPRKHPDFAWVWFTRFLVVMGQYTIQEFIQNYVTDVLGVPEDRKLLVTAAIMVVILLTGTVTGLLAGGISDRVGRKPVIYAANGLMAVTCLIFVASPSLWYVLPIAALFGMGLGAYYSVDWALGCDVLPDKEKHAAKDMAVWHIAMVAPQTIAVPIAGFLLAAFPHRMLHVGPELVAQYSATGYAAIFALAALYLGVGALLLRNVKGVR